MSGGFFVLEPTGIACDDYLLSCSLYASGGSQRMALIQLFSIFHLMGLT